MVYTEWTALLRLLGCFVNSMRVIDGQPAILGSLSLILFSFCCLIINCVRLIEKTHKSRYPIALLVGNIRIYYYY